MPPHLTLATAALAYGGRRVIDHVAFSPDLFVEELGVIDNAHCGRKPSDLRRCRRNLCVRVSQLGAIFSESCRIPALPEGLRAVTRLRSGRGR